MHLHVCTPYSIDKNLGEAYNKTIARIPDGDVACLIDYDVQLLLPETIKHITHYAGQHPNALLTCFTNRVSPLSAMQLMGGKISEDSDIRNHIAIAKEREKCLYQVTQINRDISGMLMVIPKSLWLIYPFPENAKCLGVDTYYGRRLRTNNISILRMDGIYVFHQYRLTTSITDKSHLK